MNFKSVFQAISSALQSNTTTPPPVPAALVQNRTGLPIPEGILIDLDLLEQDQNYTVAQQSISIAPPPIPATPMQYNSIPADQHSDDELPDVSQPQGWATAYAVARQSISMVQPPIPTTAMQHNSVPTLPDYATLPDYTQDQDFATAQQSISMAPPPIPATAIQHNSMPLPPEALYSSREALFKAIQA